MSPRARLTSLAALVLVTAALGGPLVAQVPQQPPAAPGMNAVTVALLKIDIRKAQIQTTLADRITGIRKNKLDFYTAQQAAGANADAGQNLADAEVDFDEAQAASESAKLDLEILQVQFSTAPANPVAVIPQPGDPTEMAIMNLELRKAQLQAATAAKVAQTRQQQFQAEQTRVKAGQATAAQLADAEMDAVGTQAAADSSALDVESLKLRLSTFRPVLSAPAVPGAPAR